ncbi:MAG: DUF87 domain-containing protein, partial [Candidatus Paceibacterota bacterium]
MSSQNTGDKVTYFAETDARNKRVKFGIKAKDRTRHVYVIGKTGMGKSTLLENMAAQDILNGEGMAFIDPHGKTADLLLSYVPKERMKDVLYFAPFDLDNPISFNLLEDVGIDKRHLVVSGLMSTFKKIWQDAWSARMEYILTNTLLALLEYPGATLLGVNRMYADKEFRKRVVENVKDASVKAFWVEEFAKYTDKFAAEATPAIQNKIGQFTSNPLIRNIIGQPKSSFDIRKMMDEKKILIINLSKGRVGETNAALLGSMFVTKIYLAAMSRADVSDRELHKLPNFYLFVDEFQSFANESFADILSEARKYKLNLTITHQYVEQMPEEVRSAVFGNVGTMITFRVGAIDAELLEKEFAPQFTAEDLVNLGFAQIYLKLMIDGVSSRPFSASTLPPLKLPDVTYHSDIIEMSRSQFGRPRATVEEELRKWHEPIVIERKPPQSQTQGAPVSSGTYSQSPRSSGPASPSAVRSPQPSTFPPRNTQSGQRDFAPQQRQVPPVVQRSPSPAPINSIQVAAAQGASQPISRDIGNRPPQRDFTRPASIDKRTVLHQTPVNISPSPITPVVPNSHENDTKADGFVDLKALLNKTVASGPQHTNIVREKPKLADPVVVEKVVTSPSPSDKKVPVSKDSLTVEISKAPDIVQKDVRSTEKSIEKISDLKSQAVPQPKVAITQPKSDLKNALAALLAQQPPL